MSEAQKEAMSYLRTGFIVAAVAGVVGFAVYAWGCSDISIDSAIHLHVPEGYGANTSDTE